MTTTVTAITVACFLWTSCAADQAVPSATDSTTTTTATATSTEPVQTTSTQPPPTPPPPPLLLPLQSLPWPPPLPPQTAQQTTASKELGRKFGLPIVVLKTTDVAAAATDSADGAVAARTTTAGANKKTAVAAKDDFAVDMILPFGKSTIRYSYTEFHGPTVTPEWTRVPPSSQAYSLSVTPYDCGDVGCGRRKKKRKPTTEQSVAVEVPTNTILPLSRFPVAADDGAGSSQNRRPVFQVAVDQLELLYTVQRQTVETTETTAAVQVTNNNSYAIM